MELSYHNADHVLECSHVISDHRTAYVMRCHILKEMTGQRYKVLVFGDRFWAGGARKTRSRIRYVLKCKVKKINKKLPRRSS